jgi:hypothetical protein
MMNGFKQASIEALDRILPTRIKNSIFHLSFLNPVEMSFTKLKAFLRKVAERTVPALCHRIGSFAQSLAAREARN